MMTAATIAKALVGGRKAGRGWVARCPCHGDRSPSLSLSDKGNRILVHCHAGCPQDAVIDDLKARGLWPENDNGDRSKRSQRGTFGRRSQEGTLTTGRVVTAGTTRPDEADDTYEHEQRRKAAWLWRRRRPIQRTIAERYLREARGYSGPLPLTLAFSPPSKPEHHPAMMAAFAMPQEIEPRVLAAPRNVDAVHLTLLKPDGSGKADTKPNKLIIGKPSGRPIVVATMTDTLGLAVCEGIEDALSAHASTGLAAWAAGAAGFLPALADAIPAYVDSVTVLADDDEAGRRNARELAARIGQRRDELLRQREPRGVCPICRVDDGYIRTRDAVHFICEHHKLAWFENYRCANWTDEDPGRAPFQMHWTTERVWAHRDQMLTQYRKIERCVLAGVPVPVGLNVELRLLERAS